MYSFQILFRQLFNWSVLVVANKLRLMYFFELLLFLFFYGQITKSRKFSRFFKTCLNGRSQDFFGGGNTFRKFSKNLFRKLRKMHYLAYEILIKFSKIFIKFLKKIGKMHYFSIFSKQFNKPCVNFCAFGRKTNQLEFLRKFSKNFLRKLLKMHYFLHIFEKI